jgi:hypothetical protein
MMQTTSTGIDRPPKATATSLPRAAQSANVGEARRKLNLSTSSGGLSPVDQHPALHSTAALWTSAMASTTNAASDAVPHNRKQWTATANDT